MRFGIMLEVGGSGDEQATDCWAYRGDTYDRR